MNNIQNGNEVLANSPVKIMIVGVGGGGSNAVDNMIDAGVGVNVFMAINTDKQALRVSKATKRVQIGSNITGGHGAGADPEKGRLAAEESRDILTKLMQDMDLVFITAGMGGGTGTGAAPVVAEIAQGLGKLTIAFVTTPFKFEGESKMRHAQEGIANLRKFVDSIVIVPNERLATVAKDLTAEEALKYADDILRQGVQALTDIIVVPGKINVDFADLRMVLHRGGDAIMAIGRASGTNRPVEAVKRAVNNTVLDTSIEGATRAIVQVDGRDVKMHEVQQAVDLVKDICSPQAEIVFGYSIVPELKDQLQVTIVATGFSRRGQGAQNVQAQPAQQGVKPPVPPQSARESAPHPPIHAQVPPMQQSFFDPHFTQPVQPVQAQQMSNGYVSLDDDMDTSWLDKLKNRK